MPEDVAAIDAADGVQHLAGKAILNDPIVGREMTIMDDKGPGALAARPLPSPQLPSAEAIARHYLTHMPFASWCPFCVAFRKPNDHHRKSQHDGREIPLMVAEYAFVRNSQDVVFIKTLGCEMVPISPLLCHCRRP